MYGKYPKISNNLLHTFSIILLFNQLFLKTHKNSAEGYVTQSKFTKLVNREI